MRRADHPPGPRLSIGPGHERLSPNLLSSRFHSPFHANPAPSPGLRPPRPTPVALPPSVTHRSSPPSILRKWDVCFLQAVTKTFASSPPIDHAPYVPCRYPGSALSSSVSGSEHGRSHHRMSSALARALICKLQLHLPVRCMQLPELVPITVSHAALPLDRPRSPTEEANPLKGFKCRFDSDRGY
jgi:hypothetical protein